MKLPSNIQDEIDRGNLWRAKEILGSRISQNPYDTELYEWYGVVLRSMGDSMVAGQYLFLSGASKSEYEDAVNIFLNRYGCNGWKNLVATFPRKVRRTMVSDLPESVKTALTERGMPIDDDSRLNVERVQELTENRTSKVLMVFGYFLLMLVILALIVGFYHLYKFVVLLIE